jgi:hypothetical protein
MQLKQVGVVERHLRKQFFWAREEMDRSAQLAAMEPADTRPFRSLAGKRQNGWNVFPIPFEPALAAHNEVKSFLRFHPSNPITRKPPFAHGLRITAYAQTKSLSYG